MGYHTLTDGKTNPVSGHIIAVQALEHLKDALMIFRSDALPVIRDGEPKISPGARYKLTENDTVLLSGPPEKTDAAIMMLEPEAAESGFNP